MIRRQPIEDDDENPERWLVSYADFITLLFAFFVVMYAISSVNKAKYHDLSSSIGSALSGTTPLKVKQNSKLLTSQQTTIIKPLPLSYIYQKNKRKENDAMVQMSTEISNSLSALIADNKVLITQNERGVRIDINESLLFSAGSADISSESATIINTIAKNLLANTRQIQVEGHTDNIDIHNASFFSNWELSAVRASSVVRILSKVGIADKRLSAIGFGSTHPIDSNNSESGRAKNRRVSIMILAETSEPKNETL